MYPFSVYQTVLGMSIDDNYIKIVQLRKNMQLDFFNKIKLPEGYIIDGEIKKELEIIKIIKQLIKDSNKIKKIRSKEVACSLPEKITYLKSIKIDDSAKDNLQDEIISEISKFIPEQYEDLYIDWHAIDRNRTILSHEPNEIILGAVKKKNADQYMNILENSNLVPVCLEMESLAIARTLVPDSYKENSLGILEIGDNSSLFIVLSKGAAPRLSFTLPISEKIIMDQIMGTLKLTYKQAEKAKRMCGLDNTKADGALQKILSQLLDDLIFQMISIEEYYVNYYKAKRLDSIFISGKGSVLKNLDKVLKHKMRKEIFIADPFVNLKLNKRVIEGFKQEKLLDYSAAIGSAINNFYLSRD